MTNQDVWDIANRKRHWLTAEEFLAEVEAHRAGKLKQKQEPRKPFTPGPFVKTYVLDWNRKYIPRIKSASAPTPEVTP